MCTAGTGCPLRRAPVSRRRLKTTLVFVPGSKNILVRRRLRRPIFTQVHFNETIFSCFCQKSSRFLLTILTLHSRCGDEALGTRVRCRFLYSAVVEGLAPYFLRAVAYPRAPACKAPVHGAHTPQGAGGGEALKKMPKAKNKTKQNESLGDSTALDTVRKSFSMHSGAHWHPSNGTPRRLPLMCRLPLMHPIPPLPRAPRVSRCLFCLVLRHP